MTFGDAKTIIYAKVSDRDPLNFGDWKKEVWDAKNELEYLFSFIERTDRATDEFKASADCLRLRIDLVGRIYRTIYEDCKARDLTSLPDDTVLSAEAEALVLQLENFPFEQIAG